MRPSAKPFDNLNVKITHKTAHLPLLEAVSFKNDEPQLIEVAMKSLEIN